MAILENGDSSKPLSTAPIDVHSVTHATVATMLAAATGNQYLNPDYLSPMTTDVRFILIYSF